MHRTFFLLSVLLLVGVGCNRGMTTQPLIPPTPLAPVATSTVSSVTSTKPAAPVIKRSFTIEEIEQEEGGVRGWMSLLMGKPVRVRLPIISVYAFGCTTPTQYCVSSFNGGCYGPFVQLKGQTAKIDALRKQCEQVCDDAGFEAGLEGKCTPEFVATHCSVLMDVEGKISSIGQPDPDVVQEHCTADDPIYTITVDRMSGPIEGGRDEEFELREYR